MLPSKCDQHLHTNLRNGCMQQRYRRAAHSAFYDWVNTWNPHERAPGGSPFQLPARLADGLGLESDLGQVSPGLSPRPRIYSEGFGSPALACRKASQLRLQCMCRINLGHVK